MRIVNDSYRPGYEYRSLVDFAEACMQQADMTHLHLHEPLYDADGDALVGRAQAIKYNASPRCRTPSRVDIWVSQGVQYPGRNFYPEADVGWVTFADWQEEF